MTRAFVPRLETLEDRCLLSSYTITAIGPIATDPTSAGHVTLNNVAVVQVAGQKTNDHAYLWDSVHGMQDLGTVGKDAESAATGINDSGQVVGLSYTETPITDKSGYFYYYADTSLHAFLWTSAHGMQDIGKGDIASGINSSGEVVGTLNNNQEAALWSDGRWTGLGNLGAGQSDGFGINDYGQVVGVSDVPAPSGWSIQHAFLWTPTKPGGTTGTMIDLGALNNTLGFDSSVASAINGQGFVTGQTVVSNSGWAHAFVWSPSSSNGTKGTMTDLGALDGVYSNGISINSSGTVVGTSTDGSAGWHAVIWQKGSHGYTIADLNSLIPTGTGWVLTSADAINNQGQIVVEATQNGFGSYTLLLTPSTNTLAVAQPASSTPATSTAGPMIAPNVGTSLAPVLASPSPGSSGFDPVALSVAFSGSPRPAALTAGTPAALPFSPAPLSAPSLTSNLPPAARNADSPPLAGTSTSAADQVFAGLDAEHPFQLLGEDPALAGWDSDDLAPASARG
jgi:probable HAF family extracellular repeat protein